MTDSARPAFSVVIPAYNCQERLTDSVESLLAQTIAADQVEIVIVDDGSTDGTPAICDRFADEHPSQVVVIHQANGGVSSALNAGVAAAHGRYIGFVGAGDRLSAGTLSEVGPFFDRHRESIDLVAIKIELFGTRHGPHWNNRSRFARTRVIDVSRQWNAPQLHGGGTFIAAEIFTEHGLSFNPEIFVTEDATLNTQVIMRKLAYGVVKDATYYYHRPEPGQSAVTASRSRKAFYTKIPQLTYGQILADAKQRFGTIPRYPQTVVAYDLAFRFRADISAVAPVVVDEYRQILAELLAELEVPVIMAQSATIEVRLQMLNRRSGGRLAAELSRSGETFWWQGTPVYSFAQPGRLVRLIHRVRSRLARLSGFNVERVARHQPPTAEVVITGTSPLARGVLHAPVLPGWTYRYESAEAGDELVLQRPEDKLVTVEGDQVGYDWTFTLPASVAKPGLRIVAMAPESTTDPLPIPVRVVARTV